MVSIVIRSVHSYSKVNSFFRRQAVVRLLLRLLFHKLFYVVLRYKLNSHWKFMLRSVVIDISQACNNIISVTPTNIGLVQIMRHAPALKLVTLTKPYVF